MIIFTQYYHPPTPLRSTSHPPTPISISSSLLLLSPIYAAHIVTAVGLSTGRGHPTRGHTLKEPDSPRSQQLLSRRRSEMFACLHRSCVGNYHCCEFVSAEVLSCPDVTPWSSLISVSCNLYAPFRKTVPKPWSKRDETDSHLCLYSTDICPLHFDQL